MPAKKILIGLDFSENTEVVVKFVIDHFDCKKHHFVLLFNESKGNDDLQSFNKLIKSCKNVKDAFEQYFSVSEPIDASMSIQIINRKIMDQCRFADMFISSKGAFENEFKMLFEKGTNDDENLCCPKLLLPNNYEGISNVALIYDGTTTSLYAVKQFCRILPEVCRNHDVVLLIFSIDDYSSDKEQNDKMFVNYLQQHCSHLAVHYYSGEDSEHLKKMLDINSNTLLITGDVENSKMEKIFTRDDTIEITDIY